MTTPSLLIEHWLPIEAIGAESKRERGASSALPPLYFLHVWWARRPLTASRAAILASVLPQWSPDWPASLREKFPNENVYHQWFLQLNGIFGDPAQARKLLDWAKQQGKPIANPYGHARAFTVNPSAEDLQTMGDLLEYTWGTRELSVLDPFAGGGSIPFEAMRYGFTTIANDLNPVAAVILKATLDYPARFGPSLAEDIRKWGKRWYELVKPKLQPYFTLLPPGAEGVAYLWARTVACPVTGKPVPLSPNWWLRKGDDPVAVKLIAEEGMDAPRFEIVTGAKVKSAKPDVGTISRGIGRSPWTGETIDGDYIKAEAQAGRMGQMLYAVVNKVTGGFDFRPPTDEDAEAVRRAEKTLANRRMEWEVKGFLPTEEIPPISNYDRGHRLYGIYRWAEFYSPRQLFAVTIYMETLAELAPAIKTELSADRAAAVVTYLAIALDKALIYNTLACRFDQGRGIRSIFDRHNFAFTWSFAEFDASANLLPWVVDQVQGAYRGIADLTAPAQVNLSTNTQRRPVERLSIQTGSATSITALPDCSVHNITVDPPYYDNVMYAELADFFYVWLKRSVGHLFPEFFRDELTNKDDEAVANPARFESMGRKKKDLAEQDYERKMAAAFREMYRVLRPEGVLTVMFTHKRVEAWDTLASALIGSGFAIKASWPVHTESEHSLHQAEKNAASSTILLVCRKRADKETRGQGDKEMISPSPVWWDDLQPRVRETARQKAAEFAAMGISGVDLYISTFGPTLSIISEHWPVLTSEVDEKTGQPKPLRPETALDLAREEVVRLRKQGLLSGRNVQFDPVTDWYLMAWDAFGAEQFPYDEARKLAIALGLDLDKTLMQANRLVTKKGEYVVMQTPVQRRRKGVVDDEVTSFEHLIDAVHTAMMVYEEDGAGACDVFLRKSGLKTDGAFKACLQALLNAIPRAKVKGKFVRPEAEVLENLRLAFFDDLQAPVEQEPEMPMLAQLGLEGFEEQEAEEDEQE
jgi:adenine-specific DNA methylase